MPTLTTVGHGRALWVDSESSQVDVLLGDVYRAPINFPGGAAYVEVEFFDDDSWLASLAEETSIFAEGKTPAEAFSNLWQSAEHDYEILSEHKGHLASHLDNQLKLLTRLFKVMKQASGHRKCLRKCGFTKKHPGRAPHEKYILKVDGKVIAITSVPHGSDELKKGTFSRILNRQIFKSI